MNAWWQYWACENATQPVNTGSKKDFNYLVGGGRTYFKRCKVIFMERFKREPWTKCIIRCWTFLQVFITEYLFSQSVIFYTCSPCTQSWLFIFIFLCLYIYSIYRAGRTWHQSVVSGSGCPLSWTGVAVQVCNMDGGASHSAERWMALFMLLFAAQKVDTPLPSHWFLNFRLIAGTGVSSCWIR